MHFSKCQQKNEGGFDRVGWLLPASSPPQKTAFPLRLSRFRRTSMVGRLIMVGEADFGEEHRGDDQQTQGDDQTYSGSFGKTAKALSPLD